MPPTNGELVAPRGPRFPEHTTVRLDGRADPEALGGKGAALDRLVAWGLPVPPTAVVTVDVYRRLAQDPAISQLIADLRSGGEASAEEVDRIFAEATVPEPVARELLAAAREIASGPAPLAVRSSATVEDLAHSSFAGQYRSVLDVDPTDDQAVLDAVRAVLASLWHPAPRSYRRSLGIEDGDAAMAAVLMRMVPARRAGVVFTRDPAGDASNARIEAVRGLAESLVSGAETPEAWLVPRRGDRGQLAPELLASLDHALEIERLAGCPQDVEWAWDGRQVWIVQARPITTAIEMGDGFDDPEGDLAGLDLTTAGIGEMLPGVLPPLIWTIDAHLVEEAFRQLLGHLAVLPPDLVEPRALVRRVSGRAAMDFSWLAGMAAALPGSVGTELEAQYFGSRRSGRPAAPADPRSQGRLRAALHDLRVLRSRSRDVAEAALTIAAVSALLEEQPTLAGLEGPRLLAYHLRLLDLATRGMAAELGLAADATATYRRLEILMGRYTSPEEAGRLADRAVGRVGLTAPLGARSSSAVFAGPTWEELGRTPPSRLGPGRDPGTDADGPRPIDQTIEEALDEVARSPRWNGSSFAAPLRRRSMRRLARETAERLAARERAKAALLALGGEVRRVHLEAGRRLVEAGVLTEAADIDLLSAAEVRTAIGGGPGPSSAALADRRRWRTRYEQAGPLPQRFQGRPEKVAVPALPGRRVEGWAASGGRYRGRVQVVGSPDEELVPGAVLVAEATDPSWSPLFLRAGALVLDRGGPLSHAAILARELGLPAVLNVPGATDLLADQEVTVDGDSGVVVIHDGGSS